MTGCLVPVAAVLAVNSVSHSLASTIAAVTQHWQTLHAAAAVVGTGARAGADYPSSCRRCRVLWSQHNTGQLLTVEEGALRTWSVGDAAVQVQAVGHYAPCVVPPRALLLRVCYSRCACLTAQQR